MKLPPTLPSPSSHDRISVCVPSAVYPHVEDVGDRWASRGTVLHAYLRDVSNTGRAAALARVPDEYRADAEVIDVSRLPACEPDKYAAEVSFAYHVVTGEVREIGRGLTRAEMRAKLRSGEMSATLDVIGLLPDAVLVGDYKTGFRKLAPAARLRQLRAYGFIAATAYGRDRAHVSTIRLREDGTPWFDEATLDAFELATIEQEILGMVEEIAEQHERFARGERLVPVKGEHCVHCPAFDSCPAMMSLVRQYAPNPVSLEDDIRAAVKSATPAQLGEAWLKVQALEKVTERVKTILRTRALTSPLPLPDGEVYGAVEQDEVVADAAPDALAVLYGEAVAAAAVDQKTSVSKASIERAIRAHVQKPHGMKVNDWLESVWADLRAAGAIVRKQVVKKHEPKQALPASAGEGATP